MAIMPLEPGQFAARELLYGTGNMWICRACAETPEWWPQVREVADGSEWEHDDFCPLCQQQLVLCKYITRGEMCPRGCWSDEAVYIDGHLERRYPIQGRAWQMLPGRYWPSFVPNVTYHPS